jgi:rhamnosyltransferase
MIRGTFGRFSPLINGLSAVGDVSASDMENYTIRLCFLTKTARSDPFLERSLQLRKALLYNTKVKVADAVGQLIMITIIIPTLNVGGRLRALIEALKSQTVKGDILVIDSSSSDDTVHTAESCGVRVMEVLRDEFDHGGTRTLAAENSEGEILIYLTQDAMPSDKHAIENIIKPFKNPEVGAAYGRQLPASDASPFGAHSRLFNYPPESCIRAVGDKDRFGIKTPFVSNSFAAYRKKALEEIGGFKEGLICSEDTYAGARLLLAGDKIAYVSDARVFHSHNYSVLEEFKRYFDIGVFHSREQWISQTFGNAGGEGVKYVRSEFRFLFRGRKYHLLPEFFLRNLMKYAGFRLGLSHGSLPRGLARRMSRNRAWWDKNI